jgi:hypothetical protein
MMVSPRACAGLTERRPKGRWNRVSRTVKHSFLPGRSFPGWEALNPTVQAWVVTVADRRIHGTTFRQPAQAFGEEGLRSHLGRPPSVVQTRVRRTVARDCLVTVETNRSSVPAAYVGHTVEVQWGADATVQIDCQDPLMATHARASGQHQLCMEPAHYAALHSRPSQPAMPCHSDGLRLASWTGPFPEVAVRALTVYEALCGQAVVHE